MLEITVFVCGAVVMIFELLGSRVLGPYFGTSLPVWTNLIGVIMGSLSLGYYIGGRMADKSASHVRLAFLLLASSLLILVTALFKTDILSFFFYGISNLKISSLLVSVVLFAPVSVLLGAVSPYVAKLKLDSLDKSGRVVGNLYALSTAGSIVGTFLSGFYLIPHFGTDKLLLALSLCLLLLSAVWGIRIWLRLRVTVFLSILIVWSFFSSLATVNKQSGIVDIDTTYNRVLIRDAKNGDGRSVRMMSINNENSSAMFLDSDELVYEYTKYYDLITHFNPEFKEVLALGGAAYSYPKKFIKSYPDAEIDVVEIDPAVTQLAKKYFGLIESSRLNIIHEDARVYLNKTNRKYDAILGDAFSSQYSIPYHLSTREAVQRQYEKLHDNGIVIQNLISAIDGDRGQFLRAEYRTYKDVFPQVYVIPVSFPNDPSEVQNVMLVALKSSRLALLESDDNEVNKMLKNTWTSKIVEDMPILTDDFAPVDAYVDKML